MESEETLREWILRHRVTWEIGPWQELVEHRVTTVGFELRLFGRHEAQVRTSAGCSAWVGLHAKLQAIAMACLPVEHRPTQYEIEPFDASLHMRPESGWEPEVQVALHIVHREGYLQPLDECEKRCAADIQAALRGLGAQPKRWSDSQPAAGRVAPVT